MVFFFKQKPQSHGCQYCCHDRMLSPRKVARDRGEFAVERQSSASLDKLAQEFSRSKRCADQVRRCNFRNVDVTSSFTEDTGADTYSKRSSNSPPQTLGHLNHIEENEQELYRLPNSNSNRMFSQRRFFFKVFYLSQILYGSGFTSVRVVQPLISYQGQEIPIKYRGNMSIDKYNLSFFKFVDRTSHSIRYLFFHISRSKFFLKFVDYINLMDLPSMSILKIEMSSQSLLQMKIQNYLSNTFLFKLKQIFFIKVFNLNTLN